MVCWLLFTSPPDPQSPYSDASDPFLNVCGMTALRMRLQKYRMPPKIISLNTVDLPVSGLTPKSPLKYACDKKLGK